MKINQMTDFRDGGRGIAAATSSGELAELVKQTGFLPAFRNGVAGFSAEEHIDPRFWFPDDGEGFWEWKGPVIRGSGCAYGKLLRGRAAFVMPEIYCELANYRRGGYDFDARYDDGLARYRDKLIYDALCEKGSALSVDLKTALPREARRDFDEIMTRLQMLGYVIISDFEYMIGNNGRQYG